MEFIKSYQLCIYPSVKENTLRSKNNLHFPKELTYLWENYGFGGYANGLIWLTNPIEFKDLISDWIENDNEKYTVVARTAFGDIFFWGDNKYYLLEIQYGKITEITSSSEIFFNVFLLDDNVRKKILKELLFIDASAKIGLLSDEECYGLMPILALGGIESLENLKIVKIKEYLNLIAQIVLE